MCYDCRSNYSAKPSVRCACKYVKDSCYGLHRRVVKERRLRLHLQAARENEIYGRETWHMIYRCSQKSPDLKQPIV